MVEEDLLIDHPIDCPICDKAGECYLQDYHFKYGQDQRRADIRPFTSRRREMGDTVHAVRRPLRDVYPLRPLHPRDQRHQRAVRHQPRQPRRDRRLSRLSAGKQDVGQRRRPVPGRRLGRQGLSVPAARLVHEEARRRLHRLLDRLLDHGRGEPGHGLSAQAAREPARQPVVDVRRRPLRLSSRSQRSAADERRTPRRRETGRCSNGRKSCAKSTNASATSAAWPSCSRRT